jgi:carbonic anhydrase
MTTNSGSARPTADETLARLIAGNERFRRGEARGAALATKHQGAQFRSRIQALVDSILPALPDDDPQLPTAERLARAVKSNVRSVVQRIKDSAEGQPRRTEGRMKILGAVYDIATGRVRWLPEEEAGGRRQKASTSSVVLRPSSPSCLLPTA